MSGRFDYPDLTPESLAALFTYAYASLPDTALFHAISGRLLDITIRYAATYSPYYRSLFSTSGVAGQTERFSADRLAALPILRRSDLGDADLPCDVGDYATSVYTTGTTSNQPVITDRSAQELAWLQRFFELLSAAQPGDAAPVTLLLANLAHGGPHTLPTGGVQISVALSDESGLNTALTLLRRSYRIRGSQQRISAIGGHKMDLLSLTAYARSVAPDVAQHVTYIQSTGTILLDRERRAMTDFWDAEVADRFGTSEVLVGAWSCATCGMYHFEPYGHPEVIALDNDGVVLDGYGRLLLTGYLPFTQMTPILRYETGDLTRVGEICSTGLPAFDLLGRRTRSIVGPRHQDGQVAVICERDIRTVLGEVAGVQRRLSRWELPTVARDVGCLFDYEVSPISLGRCKLVVPTVFDPAIDRARASAVTASIRDGLVRLTRAKVDDWLDVELRAGEKIGPG